ncbi:DinB family protein [Compostibacter hankyongensis]
MNSSAQQDRKATVKALTELLNGGHAHVTFEDAVKDVPAAQRCIRAKELPYSIWELVEHIRITQWDILEFSTNPEYRELSWPDDYWPGTEKPADEAAWEKTIAQIRQDREKFIALLKKPENDLYTPFAHGNGQNLIREAMLIADHTSYHTGQIILVRRLLGIW